MNKAEAVNEIIRHLTEARDNAASAADEARSTATNKENAAENKYDTLGLEAAYLAHGQSERILELETSIRQYESLVSSKNEDRVGVGSLITLEDESEQTSHFFLGPSAGGLKLMLDNQEITVITPTAPVGQLMMGLQQYDEFDLSTPNGVSIYTIISIQ